MPWRMPDTGEIYCRACIEDMPPSIFDDPDEAPEHVRIEEPQRPVRCASNEDCVHAVALGPYGYDGDDDEPPLVGALVSVGLAGSGFTELYEKAKGSAYEQALFMLELEEMEL